MNEASPPMEGTPLISPSSTEHPLYNSIVDACRTVFDPEIPVNIYDLGLIHRVAIAENNIVHIEMTLTTPNCPVAESFPQMIQDAIEALDGVKEVNLVIVWDPPWSMDRLSDAIKLQLGLL